MADRCWGDADRELVVSVLWTCALQGNQPGPALDRQPAGDAPLHMWATTAAVLKALTAAGWHRGHCPTCDCPDVPYEGPPGTGRLVMDGDADG